RCTLFDLGKTAEATISTAKLATPVVIMMADCRNEVRAARLDRRHSKLDCRRHQARRDLACYKSFAFRRARKLARPHTRRGTMKAIVVTDQAAGTAGMKLVERPEPRTAINDVVVQVHASGFTSGELTWPPTWTDRLGRYRTPSIPEHEL